jgi:hypothetical protein
MCVIGLVAYYNQLLLPQYTEYQIVPRKLANVCFGHIQARSTLITYRQASEVTDVHIANYPREFGHAVFSFIVNVKFIMGIAITETQEHFDIPDPNPNRVDALDDNEGTLQQNERIVEAFLQAHMQFTRRQIGTRQVSRGIQV